MVFLNMNLPRWKKTSSISNSVYHLQSCANIIHIHHGLCNGLHVWERMRNTCISSGDREDTALDELLCICLAFITKRVAPSSEHHGRTDSPQVASDRTPDCRRDIGDVRRLCVTSEVRHTCPIEPWGKFVLEEGWIFGIRRLLVAIMRVCGWYRQYS